MKYIILNILFIVLSVISGFTTTQIHIPIWCVAIVSIICATCIYLSYTCTNKFMGHVSELNDNDYTSELQNYLLKNIKNEAFNFNLYNKLTICFYGFSLYIYFVCLLFIDWNTLNNNFNICTANITLPTLLLIGMLYQYAEGKNMLYFIKNKLLK
jgi:hypothetical protein